MNRPDILLADEPTGNLDPTTSVGIMKLLDRINRTGTTIVMATHDLHIVNAYRKRVIELKEGRVVRDDMGGEYNTGEIVMPGWDTRPSLDALDAAGRLMGVVGFDSPREIRMAQSLIQRAAEMDPKRLSDPAIPVQRAVAARVPA